MSHSRSPQMNLLNNQEQSYDSIQKQGAMLKNLNDNLLWKKSDQKAQKNGPHRTIYWVKESKKQEDGTYKHSKWETNCKYIGEWKENKKSGFGVQYYAKNDRYEGGWENNMRNGQGTLWVMDAKNKLRREYTGDWVNDRKTGRGTHFYINDDRYDGMWLDDKPHGEGRMIYSNGDVYEGFWFMGKKSGYGVLTKRNGDHFEGHWVNDKREGQGSYFFNSKNQIFVGEWVDDNPKAGVYSEVEDQENPRQLREVEFTEPYTLPDIPRIELENPTIVLQQAMEKVKRDRTDYRAKHIPLDELYSKEELQDLVKEFSIASGLKEYVNLVGFNSILFKMGFELSNDTIHEFIIKINEQYDPEIIEFECFARVVAILLEESARGDSQNNLHDYVYQEHDQRLHQIDEGFNQEMDM